MDALGICIKFHMLNDYLKIWASWALSYHKRPSHELVLYAAFNRSFQNLGFLELAKVIGSLVVFMMDTRHPFGVLTFSPILIVVVK